MWDKCWKIMDSCKKDSDCPSKDYFCNLNGVNECALRKKSCTHDGDCPADQFCIVYGHILKRELHKCWFVDYKGDYAKLKAAHKPPKPDCSKVIKEGSVNGKCGDVWKDGKFVKVYCNHARYCNPTGACSNDSFNGTNTQNANRMYSFNYVPIDCRKKLSSEIALEEYGFEEHERSYSGSEILVTMGAGMVCGALLVWYTRRLSLIHI